MFCRSKVFTLKRDQYRHGNEVVISKGVTEAFRSKHVYSLIHRYKPLSYTPTRKKTSLMRAGDASAVARTSINERCLKGHGRWKSDISKDVFVE
ncbi:hypothetical protein KUTeg_010770 [Tegillarca granosa]|uniref:Uncharacterized protein n=1 Tax=Tegillarca granosa TaxID=220873 RepID=A0ABQ9F777_TEGGR|nr:hypothetical protein KUTeg_010770 [Tegillarca granosa]